MGSPYENLPLRSFWKTGVVQQRAWSERELYRKKFSILPEARVATGGSCFAQHIVRRLRKHKFNVLDVEPPPYGLATSEQGKFGYGLFSARHGNIYTVRQLLQLAQEVFGEFQPQDAVWEKDSRYYDALRPAVEPNGLATPERVLQHRQSHLTHVRRMFETADVYIFTLGLTEAWVHAASGTAFPTAPGTIAGCYDPQQHRLVSFGYSDVVQDFETFRTLVQRHNPSVRFLLTVSPVPLTATASEDHVLVATTYSKSVLRAACGHLYRAFPDVDYFPSYEIVTSPPSKGEFFERNLRSVSPEGVDAVMQVFFAEHAPGAHQNGGATTGEADQAPNEEDPAVCEERLLEAFSK